MFLGICIPLSELGGGNYPSQGLPVYPSHPIAPGGPGMVDPGWGYRPPVDPGYGRPIFGPHPGHGLPGAPVYPSHGLPGQPPYPSQGPGFPTHPIVLPPSTPPPPNTIWPPLPPDASGKPEPVDGYYLAYVPALGTWIYVPVPTTKPPTEPGAEPKG
jgi:hypothetical protein